VSILSVPAFTVRTSPRLSRSPFWHVEPRSPSITPGALTAHLLNRLPAQAIFALGVHGEVVTWGAGAEAMTGHTHSAIIGQPASAVWKETKDGLAALLKQAEEEGYAEHCAWFFRPDGSRFWAESSLSPVFDDRVHVGFCVILRDTTKSHRATEALAQSQGTFEGILAIASDAVVSVSAAQTITFFNHGAEKIFGYSAREVIGESLEMLIPEFARQDHAKHLVAFAASGVSARRMGERGEITGRRKNGEVFPAEASISNLDVGGTLVFTAVLRDVSERRKSEESVAAKTLELARSNAELEQFAYVASHDLQEPLRMVASYTQLLARRYQGQLDADADEFIGYAVDGVTRMQSLINDLLAYSRVGSRASEPVPVDMNDVFAQVSKDLDAAIREAGATVTSGPLPAVRGDRSQFAQLLQNLIGNAIKFHRQESPVVEVTARREAGECVFAVRDNGIGIAPEFRERIFVIFQRLHSRSEYPGTGIGLSICRKIVDRHGGRIWIESNEGQGTTFFFALPADEEVAC